MSTMTTVTRSNSKVNPLYKDYVNFLASYKNGKKDDDVDSGAVPVKSFSLSNSSSSTSSTSFNSDVTDFSKNSCTSYNAYLETSKCKKFGSVKPNFEEKTEVCKPHFEEKLEINKSQPTKEKTVKKSEIVIEIQPTKSVMEVSKMFEHKEMKTPPKSSKINSKIGIFEKQISIENKPKVANKPTFCKTPPPKIEIERTSPPPPKPISPPPVEFEIKTALVESEFATAPPPPPMPPTITLQPQSPPQKPRINGGVPPPPLPQPAKLQATLTRGPQTKYSINTQNETVPNGIDRNDPLVKKLVYGTLRGLYGAYHDKANDMLATLPKNMVVRSNGVQDRIEQIAANGDLDKLNGRVNPKLEQE